MQDQKKQKYALIVTTDNNSTQATYAIVSDDLKAAADEVMRVANIDVPNVAKSIGPKLGKLLEGSDNIPEKARRRLSSADWDKGEHIEVLAYRTKEV